MNLLETYIAKFSKLRVYKSRGASAPHKPVLLLAVIEEIAAGRLIENRVFITADLVAGFKDIWFQLNTEDKFVSNFSLPFFHLRSEGFWLLRLQPGRELVLTKSNSIKSFSQLKNVVAYAFLEDELYSLLQDFKSRELLKATLLEVYFHKSALPQSKSLIDLIADQMLCEPVSVYKARAQNFDEEEIFIRSAVFKKQIPSIYNHTCCISGMRLIASDSIQMIDACHIIPFMESHDDTISNGLSLCPNLHRAFDRGLISIDNDYKVLIKSFVENESIYAIQQFEGKSILLPQQKSHYPAYDNLVHHRSRFNF